jgi:hypothetical protein
MTASSQPSPALPRFDVDILADLDRLTTRVLVLPAAAFGLREEIELLRLDVEHAIRRPADGERTIDDVTGIMVTALLHVAIEMPREIGDWVALVRHLQPRIRRDHERAIESEMAQLRSEAGR